jgi:hypoxanthine-DNA glycosylase
MLSTYKTKNSYEEETLPWKEYIPHDAVTLILGTFPTKINLRQFEFFYPNPKNRFWKILAATAGETLKYYSGDQAIQERKHILDKLELGITDIGYKILRQKKSSLDNNLFPLEFTDIFGLLENHKTIKTIVITSSNKGNSVLSWFSSYCELNNIDIVIPKLKIPWETYIDLKNRIIKIIVVYSTSGAAGISENILIELYGKAIQNNTI